MIKFSDVSLRRGSRLLFEKANLMLHGGQRTGVTGANGIGKSSLFAMLEGRLQADAGEVSLPPRLEVASVSQQVESVDTRAIDYVMAGDHGLLEAHAALAEAEAAEDGHRVALAHAAIDAIDGYSAETRAAKLLAGLGFNEAEQVRSFDSFSGGWRMRLNLARALMCRSDLLLLDEPTNHLDLDAIIWLEQWLKAYQGMLLLISHDRDFLDTVCTHIVHLENQQVTLYTGNYSDFEGQRAARLAGQQAAYIKQQRDIAHMQSFVERFRAKATKAKQAQSRLKSLARLEVIAPAHVDSPFSFGFETPDKMPSQLVSVQMADFGYMSRMDGMPRAQECAGAPKPVLKNVNFSIMAGDRIGLLGANGAGKSTLIKSLVGELKPMQGEVERARELKVAYFAQHQIEQLRGDETPLSFLRRLEPKAAESTLRNFLGGFAFAGDAALSPIAPLSGGEKARLVLAAIIRQKPNLLLLDEPTNHLDLEMRHALGMALQGFEGALVLVSHDRHLLQSVSDTLKRVHDGTVDDFEGDLDDYAKWLLQSRNEVGQAEKKLKPVENSAQQKRDRKRREADMRSRLSTYRKTVTRLETALEKTEIELAEIEKTLADSSLYEPENKERLLELLQQQKACKQRIDHDEVEWLDATEQLERVKQQMTE